MAEQEKAAAAAARAAVANGCNWRRRWRRSAGKSASRNADVMGEQEKLFNAAILDQASAVVLRGEAFD